MARRGKKLSLDGSVPGVEHNRYHGGYNRSSFENQRQAGSSRPFETYDPDPGRMELPTPATSSISGTCLASRLPFTSIRLGGGLAPPSCQTCSAHHQKLSSARRSPAITCGHQLSAPW